MTEKALRSAEKARISTVVRLSKAYTDNKISDTNAKILCFFITKSNYNKKLICVIILLLYFYDKCINLPEVCADNSFL